MDKVYNLDLREGDSGKIDFLCICVEGFSVLWEEFVGTSYRGNSLEGLLSDRLEWRHSKIFTIASGVREEVKSMLPCSMTVKEFGDIVYKHIYKYLEG